MGEVVKAAQYGLGAVAIVAATFIVFTLINKFFDSKKEPGGNDDSAKHALQENTKAITKLTTFLETRAEADKELRQIQDERTLSLLGKVGDIEKVVRDNYLMTGQILDQLNKKG